MSSKIVSYRRATILSGRDFGLSQTVDIVRFNLSEILYKIYSRQTNRVWGNILSRIQELFMPDRQERERERERGEGERGKWEAQTVGGNGRRGWRLPPGFLWDRPGTGVSDPVVVVDVALLADLPVGLAQNLDQ